MIIYSYIPAISYARRNVILIARRYNNIKHCIEILIFCDRLTVINVMYYLVCILYSEFHNSNYLAPYHDELLQ